MCNQQEIRNFLSKVEPIETFSIIDVDYDAQVAYYVNPDPDSTDEPYFKLYNHESFVKATKIARISFLEPNYIKQCDKNQSWILNFQEKERLLHFLSNPSDSYPYVSTWQHAMFQWNHECLLLEKQFDKCKYRNIVCAFSKGFYDTEENIHNPRYLPSYLPVPDYMKL